MFFKNLFRFVEKKELKRLYIIVFLISVGAFVDLFGFVLIIPMSSIIIDLNVSSNIEILNKFINFLQIKEPKYYKTYLLIIFVSLFTLKFLILFSINWFSSIFYAKFQTNLNQKLLKKKLSSSYKEYLFFKTRDFFQPIITETDFYTRMIMQQLITIAAEIPIIFVIGIILFQENFYVAVIITFLFTIIIFLYIFIFEKKVSKIGQNRFLLHKKRYDLIFQIYSSMKDIYLYNKQLYFFKKFKKDDVNLFNTIKVFTFVSMFPRIFLEYFSIILIVIFFIFILNSNYNAIETIPIFAFCVFAFLRIMPLSTKIMTAVQNLKFYRRSYESINKELEKTSQDQHYNEDFSYEKQKLKNFLKFQDISFSYNKTDLIKKINIEIKNKSIVGIYGESGSGKSTFLSIIAGLLEPTNGKIYLDDLLLDQSNKYLLKNNSSIISQNSNIINDTIMNNIAFGQAEDDIDKEKVIKVSKLLNVYDFINSKEEKYNYVITEMGKNLSGGQRQRIELARALYFDREILILDEATNSLDKESEELIFETINSFRGQKTIIIVSHDIDNLKICDEKYFIKNGQLIKAE